MELSNKVAYLKGLMEGLKIDDSTNEGKVLLAMADILDEMALTVEDIADEVDEVVELVDILDEDLGDVENDLYCGDECCDDDCCCDCDDEDYECDDDMEYECVCPTCGDTIYLGESVVADGSIDCPNCGETLEFDFSAIDSEDADDNGEEE